MPNDINVRPLTMNDNKNFHSLIQSDRMSTFSSLSPDHDLTMYKKLGDASPRFWGAFANEKLVGTCGFVSLKINWPFPQIETFYQGDSFVHDEFRGGTCFPLLTRAQCEFFNDLSIWPMGFGVENEPNSLDGLVPLTKRFGIVTRFIGTTQLTEIYLTKPLETSSSHTNQKFKLLSLPKDLEQNFISAYQTINQSRWNVPTSNSTLFDKLRSCDPESTLYYSGNLSDPTAGLIASDLSSIRRLRYKNKKSLLIETGREHKRKSGANLTQEDFVRFKTISYAWHKPNHERDLANLFLSAYANAYTENYDALSLRDVQSEAALEGLLDLVLGRLPNIVHYKRRVCVMTRAKDPDVLKNITDAPWNFDAFLV